MRKELLVLLLLGSTPSSLLAQEPENVAAKRNLDSAIAKAEQALRDAQQALTALKQARSTASPSDGRDDGTILDENLDVAEFRPDSFSLAGSQLRGAITEGVANGPNDRSLKGGRGGDLQFTASADDKIGTFAWTMDISKPLHGTGISATQFTMSAAANLDKNKETTVLGLKGFPGGAEVKAKLIHYVAGFEPTGDERLQVTEARSRCRTIKAQDPAVEKLCDPYDHPGGVSRFVATYYPDGLKNLLNEVMPGPIYFFGGDFSASQTNFDYLDQPTFTMQSASKFGYGGSAFAGLILPSGQTSVTGSFTYARRYKALDPITLCQAINAVPQTQCITAAAGAPTRINRAIVSLEVRHAFAAAVGEFASVAIAPEFSYDVNNDAYSLDVPLYLVDDGKGKLRGGVRFGYLNQPRSGGGRDSDYSLGLFIGVPFSIFR